MTKTEFITRLAKRMDCDAKMAECYFCHCIEELKQVWMKGEELTIPGFGKFLIREQSARQARNPKTGQMLQIDAKHVPLFKPGDALKLHVNGALKTRG
jgi:integration host factor subunit beta